MQEETNGQPINKNAEAARLGDDIPTSDEETAQLCSLEGSEHQDRPPSWDFLSAAIVAALMNGDKLEIQSPVPMSGQAIAATKAVATLIEMITDAADSVTEQMHEMTRGSFLRLPCDHVLAAYGFRLCKILNKARIELCKAEAVPVKRAECKDCRKARIAASLDETA